MDLTLADQYYLKAVSNYPYEIEHVIENIQYALSYDDEHASANCLMGRIFMYQLKDYDKAGQCFYKALVGNINYPDTYKYFSLLRIWQGEYDRAQTIIQRGMSVQGMDQSILLVHQAIIHEWKGEFKKAKVVLNQVKLFSINKIRLDQVKEDLSRINQKLKSQNKRMKVSKK